MEKARGIVGSKMLGTGVSLICGPSESRVALLFSPPGDASAYYTISTDPHVSLDAGINVLPYAPVVISAEAYGDAVVRSWYAVASRGTLTIGFLETVVT